MGTAAARRRMSVPFIALVVALGASAPVVLAPGAAADPGPRASASVGSGVLDAVRRGPTDLLVTVEHAQVTQDAQRAVAGAEARRTPQGGRQVLSRDARSRAYLDVLQPGLERRRAAVLRAVPDLEVKTVYRSFPTEVVTVGSVAQLERLSGSADVASIALPNRYTASSKGDLDQIGQPPVAKSGDTGAGTTVAVLDTGVDWSKAKLFGKCPGSRCSVVDEHDFAPDDGTRDDDGHGTNVASLVLRVAPATKIIAADVFDGDGASDEDILAALQHVVDRAAGDNVKAVNLSLGDGEHRDEPCSESSYAPAFQTLGDLGVQPVVAAGNSAYQDGDFVSGVSSPACVPGALAVGAVYDAKASGLGFGDDTNYCEDLKAAVDQIMCFSQGGPMVGILAPGFNASGGGKVKVESGTSQAAPHVAGAIAALASGDPADSAPMIASVLQSTGRPIDDDRTGLSTPRLDMAAAQAALNRAAIFTTKTVGLGIHQFGDLNVRNQAGDAQGYTTYGLRLRGPEFDYVAPGCLCEGWGVADLTSGAAGYANQNAGTEGVELKKFTHDGDEVVSVVKAGGAMEVTHTFRTAKGTSALVRVDVSVKNTSKKKLSKVAYRRVVDWDMEPTAFSELVTIQRGSAKAVTAATDDGFATADPRVPATSIDVDGNAVLNGPDDHGALFDLSLGSLKPGKTAKFRLYYGAAPDQAAAVKALKKVKAEAYSLGEPQRPDGGTQGSPGTAILAFTKVKGKPIRF